jgi:hypothetical protein
MRYDRNDKPITVFLNREGFNLLGSVRYPLPFIAK